MPQQATVRDVLAVRRRPWSGAFLAVEVVFLVAMVWVVGQVIVVGLLPVRTAVTAAPAGDCVGYTLAGSLAGGLARPSIQAGVCPGDDVAIRSTGPECTIQGPLAGSEVRSCFWEWRPDGSLLVSADYAVTLPSTPWIHRRLSLRLIIRPDGTASAG